MSIRPPHTACAAIGIADRNTLAGVVRAYAELKNLPQGQHVKLMVGARLVFSDGTPDILAYPRDRASYGRLSRLLSHGKLRAGKGECELTLEDLVAFSEGLLLVVMPPHRLASAALATLLNRLTPLPVEGLWLAAVLHYRGDDKRRLMQLTASRQPGQRAPDRDQRRAVSCA